MTSHPFYKIIQSSIVFLKNYSVNTPITGQPKLKGLIDQLQQLKQEQLDLEKANQASSGIGIRNIFEKGGLRITLYYMPQGEIMQLHHHPSMLVITYVLKGLLQAEVYTQTNQNMIFEQQRSQMMKAGVAFIDGMRTNEKNLHQLKVLQSTLFIDILFPDYDESKQCIFFEVEAHIEANRYRLKQVEPKQIYFFEV